MVHNGLQKKLFAQVAELRPAKRLLLKKDTVVDSTIIPAPSPSKRAASTSAIPSPTKLKRVVSRRLSHLGGLNLRGQYAAPAKPSIGKLPPELKTLSKGLFDTKNAMPQFS